VVRSAESGAARTVTLVAVLALLLAAGTVIALDATGHLAGGIFADPRPQAAPTKVAAPTAPAEAPPVLDPVSRPSGPEPTGFAATLDRLLADRHLGPRSGALFVDALTGDVLYARTPAESHTPASVAKLLTSAAVLVGVGPDTRLTTRVRAGAAPNEVVLVGAGDASLTVARPRPDAYPQAASLAALAEQTATALRRGGVTSAVVRVDDSLFGGPAVSPDWQPSYVRSGVVAPDRT
jgi:D-alanyl-D-alanine carboxypeptidase/D-alanyl-D-alanine-endopeptidase (penicillin-binding protein 4)